MSRGFIQSFAEAGRSAETASARGKKIEKACCRCGCDIPKRKTYCGPCYDVRLHENIAANRKRYK